jgi:uncharacterized membrane protein YeaQ/YmgE (transglycosylase-associated protein family)
MFNFAHFFSAFLFMISRLAGGHMLHFIWLILMALCGWAAAEIVGGKGLGRVADMLLGITGAFVVRFSMDALRIDVHAINLLLFSIWGAAALPSSVRFLAKRHGGLKGPASWEQLGFSKGSATDERITAPASSDK